MTLIQETLNYINFLDLPIANFYNVSRKFPNLDQDDKLLFEENTYDVNSSSHHNIFNTNDAVLLSELFIDFPPSYI